jgi:hypothetical protein
MAVLCSLLFVVIFFPFKFIYGEGIPNDLTARVENGPYWGLATTETKAALSRSLLQDLHKYGGSGRVLFYDLFPAGYLFGANRPASNTTWEYSATRSGVMAYLKDPDHRPGTVFEMKAMYAHRGCIKFLDYSKEDPLPAYINSNYNLVCETEFYRVYTERSTN